MFSWIKPFAQKEEPRTNPQNSEKEEDGFLVVGQTRSERTTVITSEFNSNKDGPPTYMEVEQSTEVCSATSPQYQDTNPYNNVQGYGQSKDMPMDFSVTNNALQDVPFCINPKLQLMWGIGDIPVHHNYDSSKYEYDFSLEYTLLNSNSSEFM